MAFNIPTFDEYEEHCGDTWGGVPPNVPAPLYIAGAVCEEAGEVMGQIKKIYRDDDFPNQPLSLGRRERILFEMGDQLYYMSRLAAWLGSSLQDVAEMNITKLADRYDRGVIQGDGSDR